MGSCKQKQCFFPAAKAANSALDQPSIPQEVCKCGEEAGKEAGDKEDKDKEDKDKEDKDKEVKFIKDDWFCSGTKDKGGKCAKKFCRLTRPKKDDEFPAHGICYSDAKEDTKEKCGDTECIVLAAQVGDPKNEKIRGKAECDTLCKKDKEDKDKEVKLNKDDWFCSGTKDKGGKCAKKFCRLTRPKKDDEFPAHGICYSDAKEDTKE